MVHRRDELRAGPVLEKRAKANPKINFIWDTIVTKINGEDAVTSVSLKNKITGEESEKKIDGVFIFIGHTPNTQFLKDQLELDEQGYIQVDHLMQTSVPGVYAAGESADPNFRQVITSAGMGAAAAIQANRYLEELED